MPRPEARGENLASRLLDDLMTRAESKDQAEQMLKSFIQQNGGDIGYETADQVAKHLGLRPPWHPDFKAPTPRPNSLMAPPGGTDPLQSDGSVPNSLYAR
jgi:hypothetical protein